MASSYLKNCFGDSVKIGGYASCGFGGIFNKKVCDALTNGENTNSNFTEVDERQLNFIRFFHDFIKIVKEENLPLDFYSYHSYDTVESTVKMQKYAEDILREFGLENVEIHLNEWNPTRGREKLGSSEAAANAAAMMCAMHNTKVDVMCYYDARLSISDETGFFNTFTLEPLSTYYSFKAFGKLYEMGTQVECNCDNPFVYTLAATNGSKNGILISNIGDDTEISLNCNADLKVYLIDKEHTMTQIKVNLQSFKLEKYKVLYIEETIN